MRKKVLLGVLASIGVLVGGVALAYAANTFKAIQSGYRQSGEGQAARVTMTIEATTADQNALVIPDDPSCIAGACPGGALSFAIANTSQFPIRVTKIELGSPGVGVPPVDSNKNSDGTFAVGGTGGNCAQNALFLAPANYDNWPTIGARSTLQVNGSDANSLGANMLHLFSGTPQGCQGASFGVSLKVTATEATQLPGSAPRP